MNMSCEVLLEVVILCPHLYGEQICQRKKWHMFGREYTTQQYSLTTDNDCTSFNKPETGIGMNSCPLELIDIHGISKQSSFCPHKDGLSASSRLSM